MSNNDNSPDPFKMFSGADQKSSTKTFHDELVSLKGSYLELYCGDQVETLEFDDYSVPYNCSVFGKLIEVMDRFIIIECLFIDKQTNKLNTGNKIYINTFQIRAMTKLDGKGSLQDIFIHCREANTVRKLLNEMQT